MSTKIVFPGSFEPHFAETTAAAFEQSTIEYLRYRATPHSMILMYLCLLDVSRQLCVRTVCDSLQCMTCDVFIAMLYKNHMIAYGFCTIYINALLYIYDNAFVYAITGHA
jgi:hypothetical protein